MRRFAVYVKWNYRGTPEQQFEHCVIAPATPTDEERDGDNCITGRGVDGYEFSVHNSLTEAIFNAGFNPFKITFEGLTDEEIHSDCSRTSSLSRTEPLHQVPLR